MHGDVHIIGRTQKGGAVPGKKCHYVQNMFYNGFPKNSRMFVKPTDDNMIVNLTNMYAE